METISSKFKDVDKQFEMFDYKLNGIKSSMHNDYKSVVDNTTSIVNNWLYNYSNILIFFTTLILIIVSFSWVYVKSIYKKIQKCQKDVDKKLSKVNKCTIEVEIKLSEVEKCKIAVDEIKQWIEKKPKYIYNMIKEEEIKNIIERLEVNPKEIRLHYSSLSTSELSEIFFSRLIKLYKKVDDIRYLERYAVLIYEHFPKKVFEYEDYSFWQKFLNNFSIDESFREERKKMIVVITKCLLENDVKYRKRYIEYLFFLKENSLYVEVKEQIEKIFKEENKEGLLNEIIDELKKYKQVNKKR